MFQAGIRVPGWYHVPGVPVFQAGIRVLGSYLGPMFQVFRRSRLVLEFRAGTMFQCSRVPVPKFQSPYGFLKNFEIFPYLRHYPCYVLAAALHAHDINTSANCTNLNCTNYNLSPFCEKRTGVVTCFS